MSDTHPNSSNGHRTPPADLLARAADILGVDESAADPVRTDQRRPELMVTVAGPTSSKVMRLPADVPVGQLAATLGEAIGARVVSRVSTRAGAVMPDKTLQDLGLRAGSVILVDTPAAQAVMPAGAGSPPAAAVTGPGMSRSPGFATVLAGERTRAQWAVLGGSLVLLVVLAMLIGGALFGGGGSSSTAVPDGSLADQAARAWVNGTPFTGARLSSVPADLGRSGAAPTGSIAPAGSSTSGTITSHLYIVTPSAGGGPSYGLSVVTYKARIAYPVTVTPLPFATSIPAGRTPFVAQTGKIVPPAATNQAQEWAQATFGSVASPTDPMGYGLDGQVTAVNEWQPAKDGPARVVRVQVPLAGVPPDSPQAMSLSGAQSAVNSDNSAMATDKTNVANRDTAVSQAQAASTQADQAAQAAVTAGNSANPPNPPPLVAAATAAQQAATAAQARLAAAQQAQSAAISALASDQQKLTQDQAALRSATAAAAKVTSTYDVAFNAAGAPIAWAPADYLIGTNGQEVG